VAATLDDRGTTENGVFWRRSLLAPCVVVRGFHPRDDPVEREREADAAGEHAHRQQEDAGEQAELVQGEQQ
jgi:hypothetical protein